MKECKVLIQLYFILYDGTVIRQLGMACSIKQYKIIQNSTKYNTTNSLNGQFVESTLLIQFNRKRNKKRRQTTSSKWPLRQRAA